MEPISFDNANCVMGPPDGMTEDDVRSVTAFHALDEEGHHIIVTCWRVTPVEIEEIRRTGRIWMTQMGIMAPTILAANPPWQDTNTEPSDELSKID